MTVADQQFVLEIDRRYEVVVAAAPYPMDCNFYQTNKAIQSGALAVKDGGEKSGPLGRIIGNIDKLTDDKFSPTLGLAGVSFTAAAGEVTAVLGPNSWLTAFGATNSAPLAESAPPASPMATPLAYIQSNRHRAR